MSSPDVSLEELDAAGTAEIELSQKHSIKRTKSVMIRDDDDLNFKRPWLSTANLKSAKKIKKKKIPDDESDCE